MAFIKSFFDGIAIAIHAILTVVDIAATLIKDLI